MSTASQYEQHAVQHYAREVRRHLPAEMFRPAGAPVVAAAAPAVIVGAGPTSCGPRRPGTWHSSARWSRGIAGAVSASSPTRRCTTRSPRTACSRRSSASAASASTACRPPCGRRGTTRRTTAHGKAGRRSGRLRHGALLAVEPVVRVLEKFAPGSGYKRSAGFLFFWFSLHSFLVLVFHSRRNDYYARVSRRTVTPSPRAWSLLARRARAGRAVELPLRLRRAGAGRERGHHVVHRDEPLPESAHQRERPARQLALRHAPRWLERLHLSSATTSSTTSSRRSAGGTRRPFATPSCASTASATCRCPTPARCSFSTRGRSSTTRTTADRSADPGYVQRPGARRLVDGARRVRAGDPWPGGRQSVRGAGGGLRSRLRGRGWNADVSADGSTSRPAPYPLRPPPAPLTTRRRDAGWHRIASLASTLLLTPNWVRRHRRPAAPQHDDRHRSWS